jgi:hypothetical protein
MQKKLLLLIVMGCSISMYADDYTKRLIDEYSKAFDEGLSIDSVYNAQKTKNDEERTTSRSHQCNGRHFAQPDEHSVTGRAHAAIEEEYNKKSEINKELYEGYKNNFGFGNELEHKIYMLQAVYLHGLDRCGKDSACLRKYDAPTWEEMSKPGFMDQRCSTVYEAVLYRGNIVLTPEQKKKFADQKMQELEKELNNLKQEVQNKIDLLNT